MERGSVRRSVSSWSDALVRRKSRAGQRAAAHRAALRALALPQGESGPGATPLLTIAAVRRLITTGFRCWTKTEERS